MSSLNRRVLLSMVATVAGSAAGVDVAALIRRAKRKSSNHHKKQGQRDGHHDTTRAGQKNRRGDRRNRQQVSAPAVAAPGPNSVGPPPPIVDPPTLVVDPPPPTHEWSYDDPTPILAALAEKQTHGWVDNMAPLDELEARLAAGERIVVTCGIIAQLGMRALVRANIEARLVGSVTRDEYDGVDDGHVMLEAHTRNGWQVYDLDTNRQAIDEEGRGITIAKFCRARPRHWRLIADDQPLYVLDPRYESWTLAWAADLEGWYDHVLGVPTVHFEGAWWFRDDAERGRMEAIGYRYADESLWWDLVGEA